MGYNMLLTSNAHLRVSCGFQLIPVDSAKPPIDLCSQSVLYLLSSVLALQLTDAVTPSPVPLILCHQPLGIKTASPA